MTTTQMLTLATINTQGNHRMPAVPLKDMLYHPPKGIRYSAPNDMLSPEEK